MSLQRQPQTAFRPNHLSGSLLIAVVSLIVLAKSPVVATERLGVKCGDNGAFYCHDTDPKSFTRCIEHELYLFHCPEGLHFNTLSQTCDWPDNADCGGHGGGGKRLKQNHVVADDGQGWDKKYGKQFIDQKYKLFVMCSVYNVKFVSNKTRKIWYVVCL